MQHGRQPAGANLAALLLGTTGLFFNAGCAGTSCAQPQYPAGYPQYPAYPAYPQPYPSAAGTPAMPGQMAPATGAMLPGGYGQPGVAQPPMIGQPPVYGQPIPGTTSAGYPPGYAQPMLGR